MEDWAEGKEDAVGSGARMDGREFFFCRLNELRATRRKRSVDG